MVCATFLWDRLITPERAVMPFYAEFSDVRTPVALTSTTEPKASSQPVSTNLVQPKGATTLSKLAIEFLSMHCAS